MTEPPRPTASDRSAVDDLRSLVVDGRMPRAPTAPSGVRLGVLDDDVRAMVQLAAVIAIGGGPCSYRNCVEQARTAGVSAERTVDVLIAIAPSIGLARLASATTALAAALGYDLEAALEGLDARPP